MKNYSILYFYDNKNENYLELLNFCTKNNFFFLQCSNIDIFMYLIKNINPQFLIIDSNQIKDNIIIDFASSNPQSHTYILKKSQQYFEEENILTVKNAHQLEKILINQIKYQMNTNPKMLPTTYNQYSETINTELNNLYFNPKLIGLNYINDIISYLLFDPTNKNKKLVSIYKLIAIKYNTKPINIERALRFCIKKAYDKSKEKQLFFEITKDYKKPTIKEFIYYLTNKISLTLYKSC